MLEKALKFLSEHQTSSVAFAVAISAAWYALRGQKKILQQERRQSVFRDLVTCRLSRKDPRFFAALNLVDIEFHTNPWNLLNPLSTLDFLNFYGVYRTWRVKRALDAVIRSISESSGNFTSDVNALVCAVGRALGITMSETSLSDPRYKSIGKILTQQGKAQNDILMLLAEAIRSQILSSEDASDDEEEEEEEDSLQNLVRKTETDGAPKPKKKASRKMAAHRKGKSSSGDGKKSSSGGG